MFPYSILIADDEPISCYGTADWINQAMPGASILTSPDFSTMNKALNNHNVDILVYGLRINDFNTFETIKRIRHTIREIKILVFAKYPESIYAHRFIKAGASAYLHKSCTHQHFVRTVRLLLDHSPIILSDGQCKDSSDASLFSHLSNRELEVAKLLIQGKGSAEIAALLHIRPSSVGTYRERLYRKLRVQKNTQLIKNYGEFLTRNLAF